MASNEKMREDELKYVLRLLDDLSAEVYEEIIQFYYDIEESKPSKDISNDTLTFLKQNLISNPVTTSTILRYLQAHLSENKLNANKIETLYLEVLKNELSTPDSIDKAITLMSLVKWEDQFIPQFIQQVLKLVSDDTYRQYRKQILISLVPQERPELLKVTSEFMQQNEPQKEFKLTPEYMLELCYQDKTHWLLKAAQVYKHQLHDMKKVTFKINNFTKQILIMVLIDLTNSPETYDLPSLVHQLTNIFSILDTYSTADEQLQFYITEVKRELTIIKFCLENNCKIMTTSIFNQALTQSALALISQACRLPKVDRYKVSRLLNTNNDIITELMTLQGSTGRLKGDQNLNWDIVTYNSYCAITKIIDTILNAAEGREDAVEITTSLDEVKRIVLSIQPMQFCIEVIENIFACLFLRYEFLSCQEHVQEFPCGTHSDCSYFYSKKQMKNPKGNKGPSTGFMCNSLTMQIILNTLKLCLESLEDNINTETTASVEVSRLKQLVKVVNHSLWKLQLVSTLPPDTGPLQLKLCLDYVEVDESSEEEDRELDMKPSRKKLRVRRRHTNPKPDVDQVMLASTISASEDVGNTTKGNIDFISVMLAKPNSLVALALYHNDFSKANQIIEMFDLADAEIATEVSFTEQLRHLVGKIKNIIYYKDDTPYATKELSALSVVSTEVMGLVEGFLASNRPPNFSFDVIQLAACHPHLQLYSHQNASFINAVDILLSSGLNREITYGLINVVERKLAEVRCSTDVAAVKKINYIRFIEDIASVTFEIFGNTEKSFDFVDNVCGLIADCRIPIKHKEFCKMNQLSKELRQCCEDIADVVNPTNSNKSLDQNLLQKYHQIYMNIVAASDKDLCNIGEVSRHGNRKTRMHYLRMCYMYCKTVSQLELEETNSSAPTDSSYFTVLEKQLHDIFGTMINAKEIPVTYLEPICKKLNVNLIPKLILNFCPSIPLMDPHTEASEMNFNNLLQAVYAFKNTEENLFLEPETNLAPLPRAPTPQCLTYIVLHNWVLAHLIKKIHTSPNDNSLSQQSMDARTRCLNNYMELERFNCTKVLFGGNKYLASLHTTIDLDKLFLFLPQLIESGKLLKCLSIIDSLSEQQILCSANLLNLRDLILFKLAINPKIERNWKYCQYLKCSELKVNLILNHLSSWPAEGAIEVLDYLRFLLDQDALEEDLHEKCSSWMVKIPLYDQIATIMGCNHWYNVYEKSVENPENVIEVLMDSQQFQLCLEWADVHDVSDHMKNLIVMNLLRQLFEYTNQATPAVIAELLSRLPTSEAMDLIHKEMAKVRNVEILQVCVDFVSEHSSDWKSFENIKIGLQIMLEIDTNLRQIFWDLIEKPLLMIEQFMMNAKLDILSLIINKISSNLKKDPTGDNLYYNIKLIDSVVISRNAVDALLRFYAEKALDMNPKNTCPAPPKPSEDSLMQSIDSINIEAASRPFVMPEQVPSKEQWAEDYSTDRCMVCHTSIFSMIIRRHHCRRCGRLVCHVCSRNRMQVPTYPTSVKFRVCNDCYTQTTSKKSNNDQDNMMLSSNSDSAGSGVTCMDWCLSTNSSRNEAVRAEFSFEFTPNVTLCLTIMKMHSINLDYPRFLLDRSDEIARALSGGGDARLLVRARRSLLLAAAELYSRAPHEIAGYGRGRVAETGAAHAARCLAHADAMATLVKHQAHALVPRQGAHPSQIVRSLLEAEKWELALEIATKSGIPRNSVLAAWGKACLKAGCLKQAREKFAHCFKNTMNICMEVVEDCEYGKEASESQFVNRRLQGLRHSERTSSVSSTQSDGRPRANPPLLNEIISMLEDINYPVNQQILTKAEAMKSTNEKLASLNASKKRIQVTEPALNIMHTLASVKKIKQGDYSDFQTATVQPKKSLAQGLLRRNNNQEPKVDHLHKKLDPFFYRECVYYLSNYGSHVANIAFYMKYKNMTEVLTYCYENLVDKETFTESVYMECLKKDKVNELLKAMSDVDSTLEMWSEYIMHICRTLEASKRLEALYALQCGSGQHARASATCALLYARALRGAMPAAALHARRDTLAAALHHLAQCPPTARKTNDPKSIQFHLDKVTIDNLMTTMSRQMELAKYLAANEAAGRLTLTVVDEVIPVQGARRDPDATEWRPLTLFGSNTDKIRLVALVLATGQSVKDGFDFAFKIIKEHRLDSMNIYTHVAKYLVNTDRFMEVKTLAKCIRESKETASSLMSDQVLEWGVVAVVARCEARGQLHDEQAELLIHHVTSLTIKISCYLACRNVSSAYILAARHERTNELRRVLHEAERLGHEQIRNACLKRLTSRNVL